MKWFFHPCRHYRRDAALLAAGVLPEEDREKVESHLAACASCRNYQAELVSAAAPVVKWAQSSPRPKPSQLARHRWARAVREAARPAPAPSAAPHSAFVDWWRDVVWSSRRVWASLAAIWILILAGNLSLRDQPRAFAAKSSPPAREIMMAIRDRQTILAELLGDHNAPREAERPKTFVPRPRTEAGSILAA